MKNTVIEKTKIVLSEIRCYSSLSKFVLILTATLFLINMGLVIYAECKIGAAEITIDSKIDDYKETASQAFDSPNMRESKDDINMLFDGIGNALKRIVSIIITVFVSGAGYYFGKWSKLFRNVSELLAILDNDFIALKFILLFDIVDFYFIVSTLSDFISLV